LSRWLKDQHYENSNLLMMSSGTFDALDIPTFVKEIIE
jgi:hypothetical protein